MCLTYTRTLWWCSLSLSVSVLTPHKNTGPFVHTRASQILMCTWVIWGAGQNGDSDSEGPWWGPRLHFWQIPSAVLLLLPAQLSDWVLLSLRNMQGPVWPDACWFSCLQCVKGIVTGSLCYGEAMQRGRLKLSATQNKKLTLIKYLLVLGTVMSTLHTLLDLSF